MSICIMKKLCALIFLSASFFLHGCSAKQEQISISSETKKELTSEIQQHTKTTKPGAPVALGSPPTVNIVANQVSPIEVTLIAKSIAKSNSGDMRVEIIPGDGIQLMGDNTIQTFFSVNEVTDYHLQMELFAPANGRYYVNLHVTFTSDGVLSQRNLAVIIQVGPVEKPQIKSNKVLEKPSSEKLILMPAQETIVPK